MRVVEASGSDRIESGVPALPIDPLTADRAMTLLTMLPPDETMLPPVSVIVVLPYGL